MQYGTFGAHFFVYAKKGGRPSHWSGKWSIRRTLSGKQTILKSREKMNRIFLFIPLVTCAVVESAYALTPTEVFDKVSPSVWTVRALDETERPVVFGSGVVIAPGRMVTNCHVIEKAKFIQVRRENVTYEAKRGYSDGRHDLCTLKIAKFNAPAVAVAPLSEVRVGQRVFAIGTPAGLALTLLEGLVAGLRGEDGKSRTIQTTAPMSPGSSGGGLFDDSGRLVGVTTFGLVDLERTNQNLNFAVPAELISEILDREKQRMAKKRGPNQSANTASAANDDLPSAGAEWVYRYRDLLFDREGYRVTVDVTGVSQWMVTESMQVEGEDSQSLALDARNFGFLKRKLRRDQLLLELSPYLMVAKSEDAVQALSEPKSYPLGSLGSGIWRSKKRVTFGDAVAVPAGRFNATRVDLEGEQQTNFLKDPIRFKYQIWYAPEVKRYAKIRRQVWDGYNELIVDEDIELEEMQ